MSRLIALDPAGRPDYLRQLAMSQLERGKPDEARATLLSLQAVEGSGDDSSAEFEAGVLALSGLREEAIAAYRRGLAAHPERIDSYLLMANLMKEVRQSDRAVGMFQHLAENADGDDAFTIAIDGLLNMVVDAPPRPKTLEWARRITLERLAGREDAPYLYQLLADLAEETGDEAGQIRAGGGKAVQRLAGGRSDEGPVEGDAEYQQQGPGGEAEQGGGGRSHVRCLVVAGPAAPGRPV